MHHYPPAPAPAFVTTQRGDVSFGGTAAAPTGRDRSIDLGLNPPVQQCDCAPVRQAIASQPDFGHPDALLEAPGRRRLQPNRTRRESARSGKSRALCRARMHARTHADTQAGRRTRTCVPAFLRPHAARSLARSAHSPQHCHHTHRRTTATGPPGCARASQRTR